ncbi:sulfatase-like hydrolase/transferase [Cognatitamlana onchidii]|uniref:sulfatase-like hydrolase/transferase n=1 Tax=Cognatitamlana onchidii TaxID=2562860 RepID=UPI0010A68DDA|nr:sulfatase-like hydrolase/transferase [Algibacter onchidii]
MFKATILIQKKISSILTALYILSFTGALAQVDSPPNILIIVADDLGIDALNSSDYGISGTTQPITPYIQSLKDNGVSYLNTWATPQCTTTRASIISGKYGINSGVRNVPDNLDLSHESLFNYLNNNVSTPYVKALIGKWHISRPVDLNHPYAHGLDYFEGIIAGIVNDYYSWEKADENGQTVSVDEYVTKHLTDSATKWISEQSDPWFLWLSHIAPHNPFHIPPQGTYSQTDLSGNRGKYLASIESMDYYIGELLNSMTEETRDNTIIIFLGDNGTPGRILEYFPNGHGKTSMYEGGLRVPMIISGKGVTRRGELEAGLTQVNDVYATLVELLSEDLEGGIYNSYSLAPSLTMENTITRPYIYSDYINGGVEYWAIRNNTYKLIENENGEVEFYNLGNDLKEEHNLVDFLTNQEATVLARLKLEAQNIRTGWSCNDAILNGEEQAIDDCNTCATDNLSFSNIGCCDTPNSPNVYYEYQEDTNRKVYSNNYPNHDFCYNPRNIPSQSYHDLEMDLNPTITGTITPLINQITGRPATTFGVALNGVMFSPGPALPFVYSNPNTNEYNWDWVFEPTNNQGNEVNQVKLDCASAHTNTKHGYHYHGEMFSYLEHEMEGITSARTVDEVIPIGWAADGFPILYKFGPDSSGNIKNLKPSYRLKEGERPGDGTDAPCGVYSGKYTNDYEYVMGLGDLDACNGMASAITLDTALGEQTFDYFYVITSTFPQVPRCFVGQVNESFSVGKISGMDNDGDGFIAEFDCNDNNPSINPLATEIPGNSIDENCDGLDTLSQSSSDLPLITMLPNPSTTMVRLINNYGFSYQVHLYDVQGKALFSVHNSPEFVSVENLPNGIYLLKIVNEETGAHEVYKLIKN